MGGRGVNRGAKTVVSPRRWSSLAPPNSLKTRRPALACAGRAGLRIESSTTELRWRETVHKLSGVPLATVLHPAIHAPSSRRLSRCSRPPLTGDPRLDDPAQVRAERERLVRRGVRKRRKTERQPQMAERGPEVLPKGRSGTGVVRGEQQK